MTADTAPADALEALLEAAADLRHDLGKYMTFETRFVGADADTETLRAALRADLLATHRRGAHTESAWELWRRLRPTALADDADVQGLDRVLDALSQVDLDGPDAGLRRAADLAAQAAALTRSLHGRLRARLDDPA